MVWIWGGLRSTESCATHVQQETKKIKSKKKIVDPTRADQNDAVLMAAKQKKKNTSVRVCITMTQHNLPYTLYINIIVQRIAKSKLRKELQNFFKVW